MCYYNTTLLPSGDYGDNRLENLEGGTFICGCLSAKLFVVIEY